jgi:tetratricopeptide (TPR) repeat protein
MSKSGRAILLVLAISCSFAVWAQQSTPSDKPDYSKEAYVYQQITTKWVYENDGTSSRDTTVRLRVQSDAGVQKWGLLRFPYESSTETLEIPYVRVHKTDGTVVSTTPDTFQDMAADVARAAPFYTDLHEKHVAVKGLSVGDTIEYEYQHHVNKPLAPGQFWLAYQFSHDDIVLAEQLEISVPRDRSIKYKSGKLSPSVSEQGKYRVYTWNTSNLKVEPKDDEQLAVQQARGRADVPDVQLSSFQSWEEVGKWYGGLQTERVKPGPEIQAKAAELTKGATTDDAKIRAIYKYVSTDFRYIGIAFGIGRYQPHTATEVLANQYGDCKDKHTLLASLLAAAGIKAYPALINTSRQIDPDVPSPAQFDHLIGVIPQGDNLLWVDTTAEVAPAGYLLPPLREKQALVITDNRPAALVLTPADPPFPQTEDIKIVGTLSDADVLDAHFTRTEHGDAGVLLRAVFRKIPETQWKDLVQGFSYATGFGGTVSDVTAGSLVSIDEPFQFSYSYNRKDYGGDWQNHRITPPIPMILLPTLKNEDEKPKEPIWLGSPREIISETKLQLPTNLFPKVPVAVDLTRDFAEYHSAYRFRNGTLIIKMSLTTNFREVPVEEYDTYTAFRKAVDEDRDQYIQLSNDASSMFEHVRDSMFAQIWQLPDSDNLNARKYDNESREAARQKNDQGAIAALKGAVASDPKFVRGWVLLARKYSEMKQEDEAVEAFQKAIAADPAQRVPYRMLGFYLMSLRKFEDATKVWQQLIAIAPTDDNGPTNLASALFNLDRYNEAAAAYESAVKIDPLNALLESRVGSSYLRAGEDDAAAAAFQKALTLDPSSDLENEVAYELAEAGKKLPLALDYAQKAIRAAEKDSQKIDIANLKTGDLTPTQQLDAYWDTLGWVYYKMNDLPSAENYLRAAWTLSLDAVVGDHLGQLYEKQHKTEAAVHMYQLALAVNPKLEETKKRLANLQGDRVTHSQLMAGSELSTLRNMKLPRITAANGSSEIFVLVSPEKIEDVHFLSGSPKMKPSRTMFSPTAFKSQFPTGSSAYLLRRGILSCFEITGCSLVVYPPDSVHSIN